MNGSDNPNKRELSVPKQFIHAITALHNRRVIVPPEVDAAIFQRACEHLQSVAGGRRIIRLPRWLAAAAAIILAMIVAGVWFQKQSAPPAFVREDLDHNGRVDILDAFALARKVQQGAVSLEFDMNGDGMVNSQDIDAVAAQAVKLKQG